MSIFFLGCEANFNESERLTKIVEHYFYSFGGGRRGGPSLKKVQGYYRIALHFNHYIDRNILNIVRGFWQLGCVNKRHKDKRQHTVTVLK